MESLKTISSKRVLQALLLIVFLGSLLRVYRIDFQSLWVDELYSVVPTAPQQSVTSIVEYCVKDQPPVFFIYLHTVFKLFGYSSMAARAAAAFVGVLGIVAVYFLGKEVYGRKAGVYAALITSVSYFHIYYSQEARFYSTVFLLTALSYLFFIRSFRIERIQNFIFYVISTTLLLYTHYFGMFVFGAQGIIFLWLIRYKKNRKFIFLSVASALLVCLAFSAWIPTILNDLQIGSDTFWISRPKPTFVLDYFYRYTGKDALTTALYLTLTYFFIRIYWRDTSADPSQKVINSVLLSWIVICYLIPYVKSLVSTPILHERYTIVTLPAWFVIFGIGLTQLQKKSHRYIVVGVIVMSALVNLILVRKYYSRIIKEQFREASAFVIQENNEKFPIYSPLSWHFNFYFRDEPENEKVIMFYKSERKHLDKIWFLLGHFSEDEEAPLMRLVLQEFDVLRHQEFYGADAYLLQRKKGID